MIKRILGIILLVLGLSIILWSLYASFNIFTAKTEAPTLFRLDNKEVVQKTDSSLQSQMDNLFQNQIKSLFPQESVPKLLNLLAWSVFSGIMIFAGSQIAGLGIKMIT
ncbi:MAG: hypothetical protein Q7T34_00500 [Candidatus Parcubacteria bacterium]|nr:hypothetical protein [Candidatus Parcubacteria bacterium]